MSPTNLSRNRLELLPAVDVSDGKAVRLSRGDLSSETQYGTPIETAQTWLDAGAEWLHLVDIDAAFSRGSNREVIAQTVARFSAMRIELSGGIKDAPSLEGALQLGVERVVLSTAALEDFDFVRWAIQEFKGLIAVGLDVKGTRLSARGQSHEGGELEDAIVMLEAAGCSRYVITDVTRDGTLEGPNLELLKLVLSKTEAPVVASGGISSLRDISELKVLVRDGLEGAILGKALYAKNFTLEEALEIAGKDDI
jgi:1-(5-phosphoribosyl)-5-[(5-phosphoribosylamino)methylideneamino] imidazole-4-carboxamide isomerase/N-(5'phosphoribosyl)anthranilate isomerase